MWRLQTVLAEYEPPPAPIHIVHPQGRHLPAKVRLFLDHATSRLRHKFGQKLEIWVDSSRESARRYDVDASRAERGLRLCIRLIPFGH
jgi:hypothetical protein